MRKTLILVSFATLTAIAMPSLANAQAATEGAVGGAVVGGVTGAAVGGPVGAAVGAGVGGTVGASAGDSNRAPPGTETVIVAPAAPESQRTCVTDSRGNQTCTEVRR